MNFTTTCSSPGDHLTLLNVYSNSYVLLKIKHEKRYKILPLDS